MNEFYTTKKIDSHVHLNSQNPALAEQAKADNFKLISINVDVPGYPSLENQFATASLLQKQFPGDVSFLTSFTLQGWDSAGWAERTIAKLKSDFAHGAIGVKVWKNIGMEYKDSRGDFIMLNNPKFDQVFDFIVKEDKTVVGHLGEPRNCWLPIDQMTVKNDRDYFTAHPEYHMYLHPEYPSYEQQISARDMFLELHSDLRFVGAHLASLEWSIDELAKRLDKFPNMAVDMASRICHLQLQSQKDREKVRQFFIKYQDRLIYATDSGFETTTDDPAEIAKIKSEMHKIWLDDWEYFVTKNTIKNTILEGTFKGLELPEDVVNKLYYKNAIHWFKMKDK